MEVYCPRCGRAHVFSTDSFGSDFKCHSCREEYTILWRRDDHPDELIDLVDGDDDRLFAILDEHFRRGLSGDAGIVSDTPKGGAL